MNRSTLLAAGGIVLLTASTSSAVAQSAPAPQQSSADLICQLAGDCASATETQTADDANGRMGRTRSFSISRKGAQPQKAEAAPKPAAQSYAPSSRTKARPTPPSSKMATALSSKEVGRADLLITFLLGSTTLTEQAKANAQQFVVALRAPQLSGMRFAIEGHSDASGSRAYNLVLSRQRAQAVVDYLVANGADPASFEAKGFGPDHLLDPQNPRSAANRRVEVVKIKSK